MNRNGLLTLVAVLMAIALVVRLENTAQAQLQPGVRYNEYTIDPNTNLPLPPISRFLGSTVTLDVNLVGNNLETSVNGFPEYVTHGLPGTVFFNTGYSSITASGGGAVISSTGNSSIIGMAVSAPAIMNGADTTAVDEVDRIYQMRVTRDEYGDYQIAYGFYYANDATQAWYDCTYNELPQNIRDYELPAGTPLWNNSNVATLPIGYEIYGLDLDFGPPGPGVDNERTYLPVRALVITGPYYDPDDPEADIPMIPAGTFDEDVLPPEFRYSGNSERGTLTINVRPNSDPKGHRFDGDNRTLISSTGTAIENHGTLTVNDAVIQAGSGYYYDDVFGYYGGGGGVGILHEYSRGLLLDINDDGEATVVGYGSGYTGENVRLYNTQIGQPGLIIYDYEWEYIYDDDGMIIDIIVKPVPIAMEGGITVDRYGTPVQTSTHLFAGDTIIADGINGRIIVGQKVDMSRNPIGSIIHAPGKATGTNAEAQYTSYDIRSISGPTIGIHAQAHAFDMSRIEQVYMNTMYYYSYFMPGMMDQPGGGYRSIANDIQLNDNSWIFAETGISFGNTGTYIGDSALRIIVDNTSGIYSTGSGALDPYSYGILVSSINGYYYGYGGYGITDRYSLVSLEARTSPTAFYDVTGYTGGYSGSFHELQIDGKVITGAPNRAGIQITFPWTYDYSTGNPTLDMGTSDLEKLSNIFYYDPNDPDADIWGNVHYYDSARSDTDNQRIAQKFIAYNTQPNRVFWVKLDGRDPVPLTYFDEATQRWTVHPNAPEIRINTGTYSSRDPLPYFTAFDTSFGVGIDIVGTSIAYEGNILPQNVDPWSVYYGPTVRSITVLGNDALVAGGSVSGGNISGLMSGGAAMSFGSLAHVAKVIIGENNDVKNLSNVLFVGSSDSNGLTTMTDFRQSTKNYQAFDMMTSAKRAKFLYDPNLLYDDTLLYDGDGVNLNGEKFHFDNAGVHGDIVSFYNAVVTVWSGTGAVADPNDDTDGTTGGTGTTPTAPVYTGWGPDGSWNGGNYTASLVWTGSFWIHGHPGLITYYDEILGTDSSDGPSYLLGHRDNIERGANPAWYWTADDIPGRSLILDEILLYFLAGRSAVNSNLPNPNDSYGYADNQRHFREALARFIHQSPIFAEGDSGLSIPELLAGYTRDGTLVVFSNGDIYSGNIYGGGIGDPLYDLRFVFTNNAGNSQMAESSMYTGFGNIDLRFTDGVTIFNNNVIEYVDGSAIYRDAGIRVRDVYVEKTGHLLLNDAEFAVNPFRPLGLGTDYADRLIIHDVLNEGIVSGNGTFQIAQRWNDTYTVDYFEGYFINRGILAPGLPGFIGESEYQARELETTAYNKMLDTVSNSSGDALWQQLMRGVPGGQYGVITVFGSLRLMDEHTRPVFDPNSDFYNADEVLKAGEYHVTIGNDTIKSVFGKYSAAIAGATTTRISELRPDGTETFVYDASVLPAGEISKEDWQQIAVEKLGTHISWFSPSRFINKNTKLPLLTQYEQFEYLTDPVRRTELQRKLLTMVLSEQELRRYDTDPVQRAVLNRRIFEENNIQFALTQTDELLMRYGFSDVVSVYGTIPPYLYGRYDWTNSLYNLGNVPTSALQGSGLLGITQLGGIIQADRIYDMDDNANKKEKQTSFIIIASEGYTTDGSIKTVTSATTDWVFANVDVLPTPLASGQLAAVLTVVDDPNFYRNRVAGVKNSYNAKSVAGALDKTMLTNPGLALSFQFGVNDAKTLNDVFRQVAGATRANSLVMNLYSPADGLFNQIGYGHGGLSTGRRGDIVFQNIQTGQLQQPFGQPAAPPPGQQFAPPMGGQYRGQSPMHRTGSVWGAYTHSSFFRGDDGNSFKYNFHRNGAMVGSEWNLTPSSVIGGVAMINEGTLNSRSDKVTSYDYTFGLYAVAAPFEQFEVKSFMGGGFQSYKSDRYIRNNDVFIGGGSNGNIFGINDHYDSETQGNSFNASVEFARPFTTSPNFVLRPVAGFEYQNVRQDAYTERPHIGSRATWSNNGANIAEDYLTQGETSGTYAMSYKKMNFSRSLMRLGFNTESYHAYGGLQTRAYWVGRLAGDRYPVSKQSFVSGSDAFKVRGAELGNAYCQVGLGSYLNLNRDRTASIFANGDWNFSLVSGGYNMFNLNIGIQQNF